MKGVKQDMLNKKKKKKRKPNKSKEEKFDIFGNKIKNRQNRIKD